MRVPVPLGEVTLTSPDAEAAATTAVMRVAEFTTNDAAATPPKFTAVAPVKFAPFTTTLVPAAAVAGVNEVIRGAGGTNVKPASVPVPFGVMTLTAPVAPAATTA